MRIQLWLLWAVAGVSCVGASGLRAAVYTDQVLATNPVLYWNLDGNASDLAPLAGGANNGITTFQAAWGNAGPRPPAFQNMALTNTALSLDGTNDSVIYEGISTVAGVSTASYSVQTWFKSTARFDQKIHSYVIGRGDFQNHVNYYGTPRDSVGVGGTASAVADRGKLLFYDGVSGTATWGNTILNPSQWYHTVLVRDGNNIRVYLNGNLEINTSAYPWAGGPGDLIVGGGRADYVNVGQLNLQGRVDEYAVWDRPLSGAEVSQLYAAAAPAVPPYAQAVLADNPAAYWRLNETTPDAFAADASHHGKSQPYFAYATRTGTGSDVGPRPDKWKGFESDNNAPTLPRYPENYYNYVIAPGAPPTAGGVAGPTVVVPESYTTEFWMRPTTDTGFLVGYLYQRRDFDGTSGFGDGLGLIGDWLGVPDGRGRLVFTVGNDATMMVGPTRLQPGNWYHVAVTRNGADVAVYLNGELEMARTYTAYAPGTFDQGTWTFGGRSDYPALKFVGNADEVAIYGRVLDQATFRAHYLAGIVPEPPAWSLLALAGLMALAWSSWRDVPAKKCSCSRLPGPWRDPSHGSKP